MPFDIDHLTEEELVDLNFRVVERLKFLENVRSHLAMMEFRPGQCVHFRPEHREPVTGVIIKLNRKTVSVLADDGQRWNVAPGLLSTGLPATAVAPGGNVVPIRKE